jgi:hypothetical protein
MGERITTDAGGLLLRETDRRLNLLARLAQCFEDTRDPVFVDHSVEQLVSQRVYGLALGYEDLNDHEQLRNDPVLRVLAGKSNVEKDALAGKSTLNRLELSDGKPDRYKKITFRQGDIDELLVKIFLESYGTPPAEIVLDVDVTDFALHGGQQGRFFHGYYDSYCYLPLYIFCGDQILCARLRQSNSDAAAGSLEEIQRIVKQIRGAWPEVKILLRGDSGFCRNAWMSWCEANQVDYVFGLARNARLRRIIGAQMHAATEQWKQTHKRARVFGEFLYQAKKRKNKKGKMSGWDRERRVVAKAEHIDGKENPRFVVTSLTAEQWEARALYEELYCARGGMENRIKEQYSLFADRVSSETMQANQIRMYFSAMAYVLVCGLRRLGLKNTEMEQAQVSTIRTRLLKIGARVGISVRRVFLSMSSSYPWQELFAQVHAQLRAVNASG